MRENTDPFRSRVLEEVFRLVLILVMLGIAATAAGMFLNISLTLWLVLLLAALFGGIRLAGALLGVRRIADAVLLGVMAAAVAGLFRLELGAEALAASLGYLAMLAVQHFPWPRRLFALATAGAVLLRFTQKGDPSPLFVAAAVFLLLNELTALYGARFSVQLVPLTLCAALLAFAIPAPEHPIDWSFVLRFGDAVVSAVRGTVQEVQYFFSTPSGSPGILFGYGGQGSVSAGLSGGGDREELYLTSKATRKAVYLEGEQYGVLNGDTWEELPGGETDYAFWYVELLNTLSANGIPKEKVQTFSELCKTSVAYGFLKTNDVLRPEYTLSLSSEVTSALTENPNDFTYADTKGRNFSYNLRFLDFDLANPYLIELLRSVRPVPASRLLSYDALERASREYYGIGLALVVTRESYADYVARRREAEAAGAPEPLIADQLDGALAVTGVTDRVRALALSITEGIESDYDKAKAIEAYLRQYPYDSSVDLRDEESFIDAFLFETRSGYCAHYASSMVMLLRLNGIPARLAEGYRCTYDRMEEHRSRYAVTGSAAHLWPEAYISGFGWVRFEPTANTPSTESEGWGLRLPEDRPAGAGGAPSVTPTPMPRPTPPPPGSMEEAARLAALEAERRAEAQRRARLAQILVAVPVFAVLALLGLYLAERKLLYRFRGETARLAASLDDLRWLIRRMHPGAWKNRPLLDYAAALPPGALQAEAEDAFLLWYRMRYRGVSPSPEEWERLARCRFGIYRLYLESAGLHRRRAQVLAFLCCRTPLKARGKM